MKSSTTIWYKPKLDDPRTWVELGDFRTLVRVGYCVWCITGVEVDTLIEAAQELHVHFKMKHPEKLEETE